MMLRWLLLASVASSSGCSIAIGSGRPTEIPSDAFVVSDEANARCNHGVPAADSPYRETLPGPVTDPELLPYAARLAPEVRRTAVAAGLEPLLARMLRERERSGAPSIETLAMRQELADRMGTLQTRLTAMEFEVDCVRGLLRDALDQYTESETDRQLDLTIASLGVGAASGVAAGAWDLANARATTPFFEDGPLLMSIAGAVITTALGIAVISPQERAIIYTHERNVLQPVVLGEDRQRAFPTFIFRLLTLPMTGNAPTPRQQLLDTWQQLTNDAIDAEDRALAETIIYGEGGVYDPQLLSLHENLLEEMGATLDAFAGDIDLLSRALGNMLHAEATPQ